MLLNFAFNFQIIKMIDNPFETVFGSRDLGAMFMTSAMLGQ